MTGLSQYTPLHLSVENTDDLALMSASMQDAVGKIGDFAYLAEQRRFAFVVNRFVWECAADKRRGPFARVRSGAHFDDVLSVRQRALRLDAASAIVDLLSIRFVAGEDGSGDVMLDFAGGGAIALKVETLNGALSDISEPWRTRSRPDHDGGA